MIQFTRTRKAAIPEVLQTAKKPLTLDELQAAVKPLVAGPVSARSFKSTLYAVMHESVLIQRTADDRYVWLPNLLTGVRLRYWLDSEDVARRALILDVDMLTALWAESLSRFPRERDQAPVWTIALPNGGQTAWQLGLVDLGEAGKMWGVMGEPALWAWLAEAGAEPDDSLLLEVTDWAGQQARLWLERRQDADEEAIVRANEALEEQALELCRRRRYPMRMVELAAELLTRDLYRAPCPPDPLTGVLDASDRFLFDWSGRVVVAGRYDKLYAGLGLGPYAAYGLEPAAPPEEMDEAAAGLAGLAYRFRVAFRRQPGLWRQIEVRGDQTLKEFDDEIRLAFGHDLDDHLSEFYLGADADAHRRGLGAIYPFGGEGEGEDWLVGGLGLEPGDKLSYTYDFGDNIEHDLKLEAVSPADPAATYPRVVGQNRPRHRYCQHCREQGKKVVAAWVCVECSEEAGRSVLVCDACLEAEHQDHWAEELVY